MAPASHPKHEKLYAALAARAEALPDGCAFPSARELMAEFGVSQFTVSRAVGKLQAQGLVRSAVGSGTVVCHGRRGRGKRLALVTPDWRSAAVCEFDAAFVAGAAARGWTVAEVRYPVAKGCVAALERVGACDGVALEPEGVDALTAAELGRLASFPLPLVVCRAAVPVRGVRYVDGDQRMAGVAAANLCARAGHHDLGLLWSEPHLAGVERLVAGFQTAARALGATVRVIDCATAPGEDAVAAAGRRLREYLRAEGRPAFTALFVVSDETAAGALTALARAGVKVPGELAVVGYGNVALRGRWAGRITSVGYRVAAYVDKALELLGNAFLDAAAAPAQIELEPELFVRETLPLALGAGGGGERRLAVGNASGD